MKRKYIHVDNFFPQQEHLEAWADDLTETPQTGNTIVTDIGMFIVVNVVYEHLSREVRILVDNVN